MTYSEEELQQIEQYASIYLKISDMAVILGVPAEQLRSELLHQEMMLAQVGSPLAIENTHRNLLDMEDDE